MLGKTTVRLYVREMNKEKPMPHFCDAKGLLCPMPVLRARRLLAVMAAGERLELHADDPMAALDMPHFCTQAGHQLVRQETRNGVLIFIIEKSAP